MKHKTLLATICLLALVLSACGPAALTEAPVQATEPPSTQAPATEEPTATEPPAASVTPTAVATETQAATDTPEAAIPVTGETEVRATLNDVYGPILVDGDGSALYLFTRDTQNGDSSTCTDEECVAEWPPLTTEGTPIAGAGVIQNLLGMITREDGTLQVTYNGWPLYLYSGGSTAGQGDEGVWFLVSPSGNAIQE